MFSAHDFRHAGTAREENGKNGAESLIPGLRHFLLRKLSVVPFLSSAYNRPVNKK